MSHLECLLKQGFELSQLLVDGLKSCAFRMNHLWIGLRVWNTLRPVVLMRDTVFGRRPNRGTFAFPLNHQCSIHYDTREPSLECRPPLESAHVAIRPKKRLLHRVFRIFPIPQNGVRNREESIARFDKHLL